MYKNIFVLKKILTLRAAHRFTWFLNIAKFNTFWTMFFCRQYRQTFFIFEIIEENKMKAFYTVAFMSLQNQNRSTTLLISFRFTTNYFFNGIPFLMEQYHWLRHCWSNPISYKRVHAIINVAFVEIWIPNMLGWCIIIRRFFSGVLFFSKNLQYFTYLLIKMFFYS